VTTIGVDLSAHAKETAACTLNWADAMCDVEQLIVGLDDDAIIDLVGAKRPVNRCAVRMARAVRTST